MLYHDGGSSVIRDTGPGDLFIAADANVRITNQAFTETKAIFTTDGAVELYYDNSKKFETTDSGVNVTGEISADSAKFDKLTAAGLIFPTSDGLNNHVIKTDGAGNLSFASVTALSGNIDSAAVIQLIDSSYVQIRVPETYLATLIDSAYIAARTTAGTDSALSLIHI